jgi:hypothetical protein
MNNANRSRTLRIAALIISFSVVIAGAQEAVQPSQPLTAEVSAEALPAVEISATKLSCKPVSAAGDLVSKSEALGEKTKPLRDAVGYVRAPQTLALKLVNDHIVKIPAWVGYVTDPVGTVKNRVIGEARTRVTASVKQSLATPQDPACAATESSSPETSVDPTPAAETI